MLGAAKPLTQTRNSAVGVLSLGNLRAIFQHRHLSELINLEAPPVETTPSLPEKGGPRGVQFDRDRDYHKQG
jgi:hypothetical protein